MSYPPDSMRPGDKTVPNTDPDLGRMLRTFSDAMDQWIARRKESRKEERQFKRVQRKLKRQYK
jgi:hypothetical protein